MSLGKTRINVKLWDASPLTGSLSHPRPFCLPRRCVWRPWPRDPRQRKRPAGEEAGQAVGEAVRGCLHPVWVLAPQDRRLFQTRYLPAPPTGPSPNRLVLESPLPFNPGKRSYSLLLVGKSLEMFKK